MRTITSQTLKSSKEMSHTSRTPNGAEPQENAPLMLLTTQTVEECLVATCTGKSHCQNCIETIYRPILTKLEDSHCTGLVIDKRGISCSREKKSLDLVAETILRYKHRSPLRKMAIVSAVEYNRSEELLRKVLFDRGLNIRLFTDLEQAVAWAKSYP